ncbi:MAG: serine hydrolase, partial [Bacteroidia bacterium]|nr:serine hydrolase [Bacteroidia bacterium]
MRNTILIIALFFALCSCTNNKTEQTNTLTEALDSFIKTQKADIGVSIIGIEDRDTYNFRSNERMIMMSVVKFPQAVALLNLVDKGLLSLDSVLYFDSTSLKRYTWSPFAIEHPYGDARMTLRTCFNYSVGNSDNIVCDRLYELLSCEKVSEYIQSLGINNFGIKYPYKNLSEDNLISN